MSNLIKKAVFIILQVFKVGSADLKGVLLESSQGPKQINTVAITFVYIMTACFVNLVTGSTKCH